MVNIAQTIVEPAVKNAPSNQDTTQGPNYIHVDKCTKQSLK